MGVCALSSVVGLLCAGVGAGGPPAAPTFQELMDPALFPEPQRGMVVQAAAAKGDSFHVITTGAQIVGEAGGRVRFAQRIGTSRRVVTLELGVPIRGAKLTHSGPGRACISLSSPPVSIRVNGDSLFMLHVHEPLTIRVRSHIAPGWSGSFGANHLLADELGAFGLYCSERDLPDGFDPYSETVATYPLPADAVLWVGVCPPKPYDWERSLKDNVVWHWSNVEGYPPDEELRAWREYGNIVLLQSEVMLWKDWNRSFVPREGALEFGRVRRTLHDLGMRFIVYTSPYYFLKGTALEPHAMNSFEDFAGWPPGTPTGENMELFLAEITKVMREYRPDGLYFDGQYTENPAALYALARRARAIVGEAGILEWHSTGALGAGQCYLPQADAYVDFILRGEGAGHLYADFDYLRYFVSGYNINNCIGVLCNNDDRYAASADLTDRLLRANARYHTLAGWIAQPAVMDELRAHYIPRLTPGLRAFVDEQARERQAEIATRVAAAKAEREALAGPPRGWGDPVLNLTFDAMPAATPVVSPLNPAPFSIRDHALAVRGRAHTYAFLRIPLQVKARGMIVKLSHGTDGGMSWGPAVMLRWPGGAGIRIGTRSDGRLQADVLGRQYLLDTSDPAKWVFLRARWLGRSGVIEWSVDGADPKATLWFQHNGAFTGETAELLIGKVPYNGEPQDYPDPGAVGESLFDIVQVY